MVACPSNRKDRDESENGNERKASEVSVLGLTRFDQEGEEKGERERKENGRPRVRRTSAGGCCRAGVCCLHRVHYSHIAQTGHSTDLVAAKIDPPTERISSGPKDSPSDGESDTRVCRKRSSGYPGVGGSGGSKPLKVRLQQPETIQVMESYMTSRTRWEPFLQRYRLPRQSQPQRRRSRPVSRGTSSLLLTKQKVMLVTWEL